MITVKFKDEIFKQTPQKLISIFEGKGYSAIRANENPHEFFQMAEYLKRERHWL